MIRRPNLDEFPIRWRLIRDRARAPFENMAIDEMLLHALEHGYGQPTIRLYRWDRPTISLGHNQDPYEVLNIDECLEWGIPYVHRASGGKMVFHGEDLTYSVVTYKHDLTTPSILFERLNTVWTLALQRLGLPVHMAALANDGGGTPDCFSTKAIHEVVMGDSKVIGSAQRALRNAVLQHGSVLTNRDTDFLGRLLAEDQRAPIPVQDQFPGAWTLDLFREAESLFIEEFSKEFNAILIPDPLTDEEEQYIHGLRATV